VVDEIDDGVCGTLDAEEDVIELAEGVHVEDVAEQAAEPVDVLSVRGQEAELGDELTVGVATESDRVRRRAGVEDAGESLCERHRHGTPEPTLMRD
jgi:hypothetical protein